jgi:hypothetical protein
MLGAGPRLSSVRLDERYLRVRMGWFFNAAIDRDAIRAARVDQRSIWWAIGVHWVGPQSWLVNGAAGGVVWLDIDPPARARVLGIHIKVRRLGLSLEDPDALVAELGLTSADRPGAPR